MGKPKKLVAAKSSRPSEEVGVQKWAKNVTFQSQFQPSVPPSTQNTGMDQLMLPSKANNVDATEEFDDQMIRNWAGMGKKCTLSDSLEEEEECEVQDDPDADEDAEVKDVVDNMDDDVKMKDQQQPKVDTKVNKKFSSQPLYVAELTDTRELTNSFNIFMYWIGTSDYPWTIPDEELSGICDDIYLAVYRELGALRLMVCQFSEWMGTFGSTAITVLMVFFSLHEYFKTPEA
ncbi:hypothetical protein BDR07DRAFT_1383632 [Suillus spraguei]|nr:hypothetical protein BDR07DRAFT_1383632 [Suillus spraguei]